MTYFARKPARAAAYTRRVLRLSLAALAAGALAALLAAPAGAVVTEVEGVQVGLQPRSTELARPGTEFSNEQGNAVVDGASVYFIYWDPGAWYHHEWEANLDEFGHDLGASSGQDGSILSALSQYRDRANEAAENAFVFKGAEQDVAPYPTTHNCTAPAPLVSGQNTCITDAQLREQLKSFIALRGLPTGMHAIYYVLTPPNVTVCLTEASTHCSNYTRTAKEIEEGPNVRDSTSYKDSFCSYHGDINPDSATEGDAKTILYAAIPWTAGFAGRPWDFEPPETTPAQAYDCQDGGWNPENYEETREGDLPPFSQAEKEAYEKDGQAEKEALLRGREMAGPHVEEPNQFEDLEEKDHAAFLSEVLINQIIEEQANIVTDPLLTSWQNVTTGAEATDECRDVFDNTDEPGVLGGSVTVDEHTEAGTLANASLGEKPYYINNVVDVGWPHHPRCVNGFGLVARFTSPNPVKNGETVQFNGMESTVTELERSLYGPSGPPVKTYATFSWNFGDGTTQTGYAPGSPPCESGWETPCAASVFHSYTYGGTYDVTLTITDVGGHTATVSHEVTVVGPPPPPPPPPPAPEPSPSSTTPTTTSSGSGGSSGSGTTGGKTVPAPAAAAAIAGHSLSKALKKGIVVDYSVSEQVTGHFEVLMSAALAHKLKISAPRATGLAPGTAPQVVIGRAVLVTTKGGRGAVAIKLSKKLAARLKRAHSAPLLLRLIVHNSSSPTPVTVISAVTLAG